MVIGLPKLRKFTNSHLNYVALRNFVIKLLRGATEPATPPSSTFSSAFLSSLIGTIFSFPTAIKLRFRVVLLLLRPPPATPAAAPAPPFCAPELPLPLPVVAVSVPRRPYDVVAVMDALRSAGFELRSPCLHSWLRFQSTGWGIQGYQVGKNRHCGGVGRALEVVGKGRAEFSRGRSGAGKHRQIKAEVKPQE